MKKNIILGIGVCTILLFIISSSGCLDEESKTKGGEDKIVSPVYKKGDTWTVRNTDEKGNTMIMTATISSTSFVYEGEDVIVNTLEYSKDGYTDEAGNEWDDWTITGTAYGRQSDNDLIHIETEGNSRVRESSNNVTGEWHDVRSEVKTSYTYSGSDPAEISIGDTYTTKVTIRKQQTTWVDGDEVDSGTDTKTETRNYEVLGKKKVSVGAGQFECFEIRYDVVEEDTYNLLYYSPKVKQAVKEVEYSGTNIVNMLELVSYNVS